MPWPAAVKLKRPRLPMPRAAGQQLSWRPPLALPHSAALRACGNQDQHAHALVQSLVWASRNQAGLGPHLSCAGANSEYLSGMRTETAPGARSVPAWITVLPHSAPAQTAALPHTACLHHLLCYLTCGQQQRYVVDMLWPWSASTAVLPDPWTAAVPRPLDSSNPPLKWSQIAGFQCELHKRLPHL